MAEGGISGQFYLSLKINGQDLPALRDCVRSITIVNGVFAVPSATLELDDRHGVFNGAAALVDGTKITITRGRTGAVKTSTFTVMGSTQRSERDTRIRVTALLDVPKFFVDVRAYTKQGPSSAVLQDVASRHGLTLETNVNSSDDNMPWRSFNTAPRMFLETVEQHMYLPDGGYPQIVVTEDKRLRVMDVIKQMEKQPAKLFCFNYSPPSEAAIIAEISSKSVSGAMNMNVSYGTQTRATNSDGKVERYDKGKIRAQGTPNVNSEQRSQVAGAKVNFEHHMAVSNGASASVHKNWVKAYDNWRRQFSAFSEFQRIRVEGSLYDVDLLEPIEVYAGVIRPSGETLNKRQSGKWLVAGSTELIRKSGMSTALLLMRNFTGEKGTTELGGGSNEGVPNSPSVADEVRPPQQNDSVRQGADGMSALESTSDSQWGKIDNMLNAFANSSQSILEGIPELANKYGPNTDFLDAFMSEFNMATMANSLCSMLSPLEKLVLNFSIKDPGSIFAMLSGRLDMIEDLLASFFDDLNSLISKGDIPENYRDVPSINVPCAENKMSDLNAAIGDKLGTRCLDALSLDRLHGPSIELGGLLSKWEEYLRKYACAFGSENTAGMEIE